VTIFNILGDMRQYCIHEARIKKHVKAKKNTLELLNILAEI
jgi:hypothetical protein